MKMNLACLFITASCFMFVIGGCATDTTVKKEEPIAPTGKTISQVKVEPVNSEQSSAQPVKQVPIKEKKVPYKSTSPEYIANLNAALEKIYFDFDSYDLSPEARFSLRKNMQIIKNNPTTTVRIEGNCDERGSTEYNLALGESRAKEAMQYLVALGLSPDRFSVISYGKERPAVSGDEESVWSKNRRDELVILRQ